MSQSINRIKARYISLAVIVLALFFFPGAAEASMKNTDAFSIEVETQAGHDGIPLQVVLSFTDVKADFLGDIFLSVPYNGTDYVLFSRDLQLEKGSDLTVNIPTGLAKNGRMLRVEIKDRKNKTLFSHDIWLSEREAEDIWEKQNSDASYDSYSLELFETNNSNGKKPVLLLYFIILFIYIFVVLPGLFIILKKKDKINYLRELITLAAVLFSGIIFICGAGTRLTAPSLRYVRVIEYTDKLKNDRIVFSVQMPYSQEIQLSYDKSLSAEGLFVNEQHEKGSDIIYNHYRYSIFDGIDESFITMDTSVAVKPVFFKLHSEKKPEAEEIVKGRITLSEKTASGSVSDSSCQYDEAVLLCSRGVIRLGKGEDSWQLKDTAFEEPEAIDNAALKRFIEGYELEDSLYLVGIRNSANAEFIDGAEDFDVSGITIYVKKVEEDIDRRS